MADMIPAFACSISSPLLQDDTDLARIDTIASLKLYFFEAIGFAV